MPIDWKDQQVKDRLLAAIIASFDNKINCREVARIFGPQATYNAIENSLRKPKKLAEQLREEASGRPAAAASPVRPRAKVPSTPKKSDGVKSGRLTKTTKLNGSPLKKEIIDDENDFLGGDADIGSDTTMVEEFA